MTDLAGRRLYPMPIGAGLLQMHGYAWINPGCNPDRIPDNPVQEGCGTDPFYGSASVRLKGRIPGLLRRKKIFSWRRIPFDILPA